MATGATLFGTSRAAYNRPHIHIGSRTKTTSKAKVLDKILAAISELEKFDRENSQEIKKVGPTDGRLLSEASVSLYTARRRLKMMITK